jgi:hypothetical protein
MMATYISVVLMKVLWCSTTDDLRFIIPEEGAIMYICIYVFNEVDLASVSTIFRFAFGMVWYILVFILIYPPFKN